MPTDSTPSRAAEVAQEPMFPAPWICGRSGNKDLVNVVADDGRIVFNDIDEQLATFLVERFNSHAQLSREVAELREALRELVMAFPVKRTELDEHRLAKARALLTGQPAPAKPSKCTCGATEGLGGGDTGTFCICDSFPPTPAKEGDKDTGRLDWLDRECCEISVGDSNTAVGRARDGKMFTGSDLRKAVDAAMASTPANSAPTEATEEGKS